VSYPVVRREQLARDVVRLEVQAPRVALKRHPGQFVIVRLDDHAERIPLTVAASDPAAGTITLVVQAVGRSTIDLCRMSAGDELRDVAGPLGRPTELLASGHAVCVGGGVGTAVVLPIATALAEQGVRVTSIVGARSRDRLVLVPDLGVLGTLLVCTDDGSAGRAGVVSDVLADVCAAEQVDAVYAVGPVPMMRACAEVTRPSAIPTTVSLNAIMVDGTGMCGGCRVSVGGRTAYACVDGPEFDGHLVDFDLLADRLTTYRDFEHAAVGPAETACRLAGEAS
jgi:ferredoxin--NADP+ reductase